MSSNKPSASDRLKRGSPVTQPSAAQQPTAGPARVKPYRLTVDVSPADYDHLRGWAHEARMSHSEVLRTLVQLLRDPSVSQQVLSSAAQQRPQT